MRKTESTHKKRVPKHAVTLGVVVGSQRNHRFPLTSIGNAERIASHWPVPIGALLLGGALLLMGALLSGCANPVMPTGGPPDETPPILAESTPSQDEVRVSSDLQTIRLVFEDYLNEGSLEQALSITPPIDGNLEYSWRSTRVDIELPHSLAENTTYILTLDTDLQTWRNVNLDSPLTLAFSTGDVIDQGEIAGRVIGSERGAPQENIDIFAYPAPDGSPPATLPDRPVYRTQTGADGTYNLQYLTEQPYFVIAILDRNRNRRPDPGEPYAPPPVPLIDADTTATSDDQTWIIAERDTIPPRLLRTQPRSAERTQFRFDKPIQLANTDFQAWSLVDSLRAEERNIYNVFVIPDDETALVLQTEPLAENPHLFDIPQEALADTAGTLFQPESINFTPGTGADTVQTRFRNFLPRAGGTDPDTLTLHYGQRPGVRFNQPIDTTDLRDVLTLENALGQEVPFTFQDRPPPDYRLVYDHEPSDVIRLHVDQQMLPAGPDTVRTRAYYRPSVDEVGEIAGRVEMPVTEHRVVIELWPDDAPASVGRRLTTAEDDGSFTFEFLPEGTYTLRAFVDRAGDGRWDPGSIIPYVPPAPLTWLDESVRVRERWETTLPDPLILNEQTTPQP